MPNPDYGVAGLNLYDEEDLFTKITGQMKEATQRGTYQDYFQIQQGGLEESFLGSLGKKSGQTSGGKARGFAGSSADDSMRQQLEGAYAREVMGVEEDITAKMTDAGDNIRDITQQNQQTSLQLKQLKDANDDDDDGGCCWILLEVSENDKLDTDVRQYRDERMNDVNRNGYRKVANVLIPLMRKHKSIKLFIKYTFYKPAKLWARWYYNKKGIGWIFEPLRIVWLGMFTYLGKKVKLRVENG